jgi:hypothetical protein
LPNRISAHLGHRESTGRVTLPSLKVFGECDNLWSFALLNKGCGGLVAGVSFGYKVPSRERLLKSNFRAINLESAGG